MRLNYLITTLFLFALLRINAQSLVNYSLIRNTGVTYASINLTGSSFASWRNSTNFTQDDNRSDFTDIGFDFWYDGIRYTQFCVSTNGFLDFAASTADGTGGVAFSYDNTVFTTTGTNGTHPAIAPFYDDLTAQGGTAALGNSLKHLLSGSAPNRTLTIEWLNMAVYQNTTPSLNFQVQLVETSGVILINYGTMTSGSNNFSYSMGLNAPTVSATPTTAQLKTLQTANGTTFSNTVQNALVTVPTSSSQYIFTPVAPSSAPGSLSFSGVAQTSMTLNWTNLANNEVGYVIYNSTDGINYDFAVQTASNATSASIIGLLPSTSYSWRVYAVTEGRLSSALNGTQATLSAGTKTSRATGNWNTATTWTPTGVPTAGDNVIIANTHVVSINTASPQCNDLTIGQGASGILRFTGTARTMTVTGDITVNAGATFSINTTSNVTHTLTTKGDIINNGTINFVSDANSLTDVFFVNDGNQTISGTGATNSYHRLRVSLGTSATNTLEITSSGFSAASNFLDLLSGTFKVSTTNAVNITLFTAATTVAVNTGLCLNSSNLTMSTTAGVTLYGNITVNNGTLSIGNGADEDLVSNGGSIFINGGAFNLAGKLDGSTINNLCNFNISGGTFVVPTFTSTSTTVAPFHIAGAGSQCNMTGGSIVIQRAGGSGQNLGYTNINTSGSTVSGGTLQIGNASTPAAQIVNINTDAKIQNFVVNSANATARLNTNTLAVNNNISIVSGTLNANNLALSLGGNWSDAGSFTPGTGTVTFNGSSTQSVFKSGGETFNTVLFSGSGTKTFSAPVTTSSNFSIASGASVNVSTSNHSLTVKGNFINSGTFNAQSGVVTFSGTSTQTIGGSSATTFYDLTLNNTAGAILGKAENLKNALTLSSGTLNVNSQVFTMLSDASNTARIAPIVGTGNFSGNVTIQRFAPGGFTGWALLGSPLSSALTMSDWDDDIYISCATCPDGSAAGFISVYTYSEQVAGAYDGAASYVALTSINNPITPGKGYWVYLGDGPTTTNNITLDLTGTPQKFAVAMPLNYTNHGTPTDDGWNLITNPYPSPISWASLKGATANVDNAVYVYNTDLNSGTGGFASYVNGISSPAVGSGGQGDVIAMGQGFYVHITGAATLTAQESHKTTSNTTFLKTQTANSSQQLLRLTLKGAGTSRDETVLYFEPNAHDFFDIAYDSYKLRSQDPGASFLALENGSDAFQINGIAPVNGSFSMPVKALTGSSGIYTITAANIASFPQGICIMLYDHYTGITTDLKTSDYVFTLSDTTTVARFKLNMTLNSLNISTNLSQPSCTAPNNGSITAVGNNNGPWNYYWSSNGTAVRTRLNKNSADTLTNLNNGTIDLSISTVGMCDDRESSFTIYAQVLPVADFTSIDTLFLDQSTTIQFNNTSINAVSDYWGFGTTQDFSNDHSPSFSYTSPGDYQVSLIVTSTTGCADTTSRLITVLAHELGIAANNSLFNGLLLKTFENNLFLLQGDFEKSMTVHIHLNDAYGKTLMDFGTIDGNHFSLPVNLQEHAHGIYFLSVISGSEKKVIKLAVK